MNRQSKETFTHEWTVFCQRAIIEQGTNVLSLIDTIEQLTVNAKKKDTSSSFNTKEGESIPVRIEMVSRFRRFGQNVTPLDVDVLYEFFGPNGEKLGSIPASFTLGQGINNFRMRVVLQALKLTTSGLYTVVVKARDVGKKTYRDVGSAPLEVVLNV